MPVHVYKVRNKLQIIVQQRRNSLSPLPKGHRQIFYPKKNTLIKLDR